MRRAKSSRERGGSHLGGSDQPLPAARSVLPGIFKPPRRQDAKGDKEVRGAKVGFDAPRIRLAAVVLAEPKYADQGLFQVPVPLRVGLKITQRFSDL